MNILARKLRLLNLAKIQITWKLESKDATKNKISTVLRPVYVQGYIILSTVLGATSKVSKVYLQVDIDNANQDSVWSVKSWRSLLHKLVTHTKRNQVNIIMTKWQFEI